MLADLHFGLGAAVLRLRDIGGNFGPEEIYSVCSKQAAIKTSIQN